ncbi:MAG: PorT family protein [Cyclobacteriaceae bacterium]|nr:PorT family protein [Cyclobacteriaceae bacterium]
MKRLLLIGLLITSSVGVFAQCAQTLRLARATYEQGRLHEIESQLQGCLESPERGGFSKQDKQLRVEALKILCMSYIYLEEPQKADNTMLKLKQADPYYRPNEAVDPAEFVALYKSFREEPVYRIGARLGVNFSRPNVSELITVIELAEDSEYKEQAAFQFGAVIDVPVTLFQQKDKWTLHGELLFQQRRFGINQKEAVLDPFTGESRVNQFEGAESQIAISLPVTLEYKFLNTKFNPYIAVGISTDYLANSKLTAERKKEGEPGVPERGEHLERTKLNLSGLAAVGIKWPTGPGFIVLEVRYAHGLNNMSTPETAYANQSLALDYGYADSVFKLSSLSVAGSFVFNKHNPKKLTSRK